MHNLKVQNSMSLKKKLHKVCFLNLVKERDNKFSIMKMNLNYLKRAKIHNNKYLRSIKLNILKI